MHVLVSNRQRRIRLNIDELRKRASDLSDAVLENLIYQPATHFSKATIGDLKDKASLSLVFVSNRGIAKINKLFRGKNSATDVLSFALNLRQPDHDLPWQLGEILISMEKAQEQAKIYKHSLKREFAFLFVHGLLHILGFDHENPQDEKAMFARQKAILKQAGYQRH